MVKSSEKRQKLIAEFGRKPVFLPDATRGAVKALTFDQLESVGVQHIVSNTLHMLMSPGPNHIASMGGIHEFIGWDGLILTDSGGFQVFSLLHRGQWDGEIHDDGATFVIPEAYAKKIDHVNKRKSDTSDACSLFDENGLTVKSPRDGRVFELTPEKVIDIQMQMDSDVMVVLDDCRKTGISRDEAEKTVERTIKWAERGKKYFDEKYGGSTETGKLLTAVVQGANYPDLRRMCATELSKMGFDGYNFGGYLLDEQGNLVVDELKTVYDATPADKFNYAMGCGKPTDIIQAIEIGYTVFDTVLPTRNARHGTLYSFDIPAEDEFKLKIKNARFKDDNAPVDSTCDCELCTRYSRAYLHQMFKVGELTALTLATLHNLRFYQRLIEGERGDYSP